VVCAPASCTAGNATPAAHCTGTGACGSVSPVSCNGYACSGTVCGTSCGSDAQCQADSYCSGSLCVPLLALGKTCTRSAMCASAKCAPYNVDVDQDGYGSAATATVCGPASGAPPGYSTNGLDCNDAVASINPGATEVVGDGVDQNCDGKELCYQDLDQDGYRTDVTVLTTVVSCSGNGLTLASKPGGDCNDASAAIHPGAVEQPGDGVDQDCDGMELCFRDADLDGYRTTNTVLSQNLACSGAGEAPASMTAGDCCDQDAQTFPGQSAWFTTANACGSFDYNCNFVGEPQFTVTGSSPVCTSLSGACVPLGRAGWASTVPACGAAGITWACDMRSCTTTSTIVTQPCH